MVRVSVPSGKERSIVFLDTYLASLPAAGGSGRHSYHRINWYTSELEEMRSHLQLSDFLYSWQGGDRLKKERNAFRIRYRKAIRQAKIKANGSHILSSRNFAYSSWKKVNDFRNNCDSFQTSELDADAFLIYFDSVPEVIAASISDELMEDPINLMEQLTEEKP
ncbi:hypothetical protein HHI36_011547 [Cryptolaemus montrouzieri]|uniref:Uncharacterized protein n=1 Tax=Cryptolaemus montrouzieri TaxID=559131 RepID=A0ABD2MM09_9CUCU